MWGDARDFNNIETRAVINCFLQGKEPKEIHAILTETLEENAPSYVTVRNWVAKFKRGDFSTCDAPRPGRHKTLNTPGDYWSNSRANLGRPPGFGSISSWATGHITWAGWVHHSWRFGHEETLREVGPEMPKRGSNTSTVSDVRATFGFLSLGAIQMISCREWWMKPVYITMTRIQSNNQWSGGIATHHVPKIPSAKIRWKISRLDFLGSRRHSPHWLSSKGPNYQRGILLISAGAIEGHFEEKNSAGPEGHQGGLILARPCTSSPGTCNPEETCLIGLPMSWPPTQFSGSGPVGLPPVPWAEKTIDRSPFFFWRAGHCCRGDLAGRTNSEFF